MQIRKLRADLNSFRADLSTRDGYGGDIHAVADLIKTYLREMPDCLLTSALYNQWMEAARIQDHDTRLRRIKVGGSEWVNDAY